MWDFGCWDARGSGADITSLGVTLIKLPLGSGFILKNLCRIICFCFLVRAEAQQGGYQGMKAAGKELVCWSSRAPGQEAKGWLSTVPRAAQHPWGQLHALQPCRA